MAFDFTCLQTVKANSRSSSSSSVGARLVTTLRSLFVDVAVVAASAAGSRRPRSSGSCRRARGSGSVPASSTRTFLLRARTASASGVASGAITTSRKRLVRSSAVAASERAVDRDDAAVDRHRIAGIGLEIGAVLVRADRDAAGIGVLDHDDGRLARTRPRIRRPRRCRRCCCRKAPCPGAARRGDAGPLAAVGVEGGLLMRVLAVAQGLHALGRRSVSRSGKVSPCCAGEPAGDRRVVGRGARIGLGRELAAQRQGRGAVVRLQLVEHGGVVGRDRRRR